MSTAREVAARYVEGIRLLMPYAEAVGRFIDYLPYALMYDLPRVNADADPPPMQCHHEDT